MEPKEQGVGGGEPGLAQRPERRGSAAAVRVATLGLGLPCPVRRLLARARPALLGRDQRGAHVPAHLGASLRKGWFRMIGTVVGAVLIVLLTACFPQDRAGFLIGLALWGA